MGRMAMYLPLGTSAQTARRARRLDGLTTTYRGFKLEIDGTKGAFRAHIISLECEARFIVAGNTAFGAVEEAFDLVDDFISRRL